LSIKTKIFSDSFDKFSYLYFIIDNY